MTERCCEPTLFSSASTTVGQDAKYTVDLSGWPSCLVSCVGQATCHPGFDSLRSPSECRRGFYGDAHGLRNVQRRRIDPPRSSTRTTVVICSDPARDCSPLSFFRWSRFSAEGSRLSTGDDVNQLVTDRKGHAFLAVCPQINRSRRPKFFPVIHSTLMR